MPIFEVSPSARSRCLAAIDWLLPDPGLGGPLWQAAREFRRELYPSMRKWAREARAANADELVRRASLIMEAVGAGRSGDLDAAIDLLLEYRQIFAGDALLHLNSGVLQAKAGQLDGAKGSIELATRLDPKMGAAWAILAVLCTLEGDWTGARDAALRAIGLGVTLDGFVNLCLANACVALSLPIDEACGFAVAEHGSDAPPRQNRFDGLAQPKGEAVVFMVVTPDQLADVQATIWSLCEAEERCAVHVHVVTPDSRTAPFMERLIARAAPVQLRWSSEHLAAEDAGELKRHLRTIRFERLRDFLEAVRAPVVLAGAGVLFRRAPEAWITPSRETPVCIAHCPGRLIWEQFPTEVVGVFPGATADAFLGHVASFAARGFMRDSKLDLLDQVGVWAAVQACPEGAVLRMQPPRSQDPGHDPKAGAWPMEPESEAYAGFRKLLLAARADLVEPPQQMEPVNELLQSVFGPMLVNRHDSHVTPSMREHAGSEAVQEIKLLRPFIRPGDTVLDVGANIGTHTVPFCQAVGPQGRVLAFEPQRIIYQVMVANVALNSCLNADCRLTAVGDKRGKLQVPVINYAHQGNFGRISFTWNAFDRDPDLRTEARAAEEVGVITLDSLALAACGLIKIDVEGMEDAVLRGARKTIEAHRPIIYMECFEDEPGRVTASWVKARGYRVFRHVVLGGENVLCIPRERDWGVVGLAEI